MERLGLEDRDPDIPPCDALAEAIVLLGALNEPERYLDGVDLEPLLVFPEHRTLLRLMRWVRAQTVGQRWSAFYVRFWDTCERRQPGLAKVLDYDLLSGSWRHWIDRRLNIDERPPSEILGPGHLLNYGWWLERLRRVAAARRLIEDAQHIAAAAWRGDVDGAYAAADRIRILRPVVRVDV